MWAHHGWYEEERKVGAEYRIDVEMNLRFVEINLLTDTIDYAEVVDIIKTIMQQEIRLIEQSCHEIFKSIQMRFLDKIEGLKVTVTKLNIPINNLSSTSFTIAL